MSGTPQTYAIDVGGRQLLVGGDWHLVESAAGVKAVKADLPGSAILFELAHATDRSVAIYGRPAKTSLKPSAASGGAIVALHAPNVFVCHQLDSAHFWVFAAVDGHPLPGLDRVVRESEVAQMLADARSSGSRLTVVGSHAEAETTLDGLLQAADAVSWLTATIKARKSWVVPAAGFGLCAVVVGVYFAYLHFMPSERDVVAQAPTPAPRVLAPAPVQVPASSPPQMSAPEMPLRISAVAATRAALDAVRGLPTSVNGWVASLANCRVAEGKCSVTWAASPGATPAGAKSIPYVDLNLDAAVGKQVTSVIDFKVSGDERVIPVEDADLLSLYSIDSNFQSTPNVYTVTVAKPERGGAVVGGGQSVARVTSFGPMWSWEKISSAIQRQAISVESLTLSQLATNDPQIRVAAIAYLAQSPAASNPGQPGGTQPLSQALPSVTAR
ncbi:hypothetical protein ABIC83_002604 [Roseateles asaccharophilus]|uniref:hypothetical protein n=1 Tax=Roseateles asaccharophilus TaxID=582607 RepID=UPI003834CA5A